MTPRLVKGLAAVLAAAAAVWSHSRVATEHLVTYSVDYVQPQLLRDYSPPWIVATAVCAAVALLLVVDLLFPRQPVSAQPVSAQPVSVEPGQTAPAGPGAAAPPDPAPPPPR